MSAPFVQRFGSRLFERRWITGGIALLLIVVSLFLGWQWEQRENADQVRQVTVQARILAGSVAGALAFDDYQTASEYLMALRANDDIEAAGVYNASGNLVAGFAKPGETVPRRVERQAPSIHGADLVVVEPVRQANLALGTIYLRSIVEPLSARLSRYVAIGTILVLAALLIALLGAAIAAAAAANRQLLEQIAAREQAETALRQAQKMEALGQLTGGVAHDFNNLLMAASSGLELMQRAKDAERRDKLAEGIRNALDRGAQITQQLLAFSRRSPLNSEVLKLDEHIDKLAGLLDHSLRENVSVRFAFPGDLWPVEVDVSQFDVAILNLAVNAKDAMPHGGLICIAAANRPGALDGADAVEIAVEDEGVGMSPEQIEKAFEPFFTTKEVGRGTGLGLSQVYGFAQSAGGTVSIDSQPGQGTTITLLLPRSLPAPEADAAEPTDQAHPSLEGLRVLLVEDDPNLNELVGQMLQEQGSQVLAAATAAEGLDLFERNRVDAVLSDMVMPGEMGGLDLARRMRAMRKDFPVVLMTGYSAAAGPAAAEGFAVLRKPFT
ncbi:MAG: response regulator, partial [Porphyrobacter sp.]|nr:response regulator [Porphyrobacter sp.]